MNTSIIRPARITELTSRFQHCVTGYFGEPVFDPSGTRLVYVGFDSLKEGKVIVRDLAGDTEQEIARTPFVSYHSNAQRWVCGGRGVLFSTGHEGQPCPAVVWLEDAPQTQVFESLAGWVVRCTSVDGYRGYGNGPPDEEGRQTIRRLHFEDGKAETLFTAQDILDALPAECPERDLEWHFSHPVPNRAETLLFVKFQKPRPWTRDSVTNFPDWGVMAVIDLQSGAVRSLGGRVSGHPYWMPDDCSILNIKQPFDGSKNRHLVVTNALTGEERRLVDLPIEGPGHPSVSRSGEWFVTDAFTVDGKAAPIYVGKIDGSQVREIARMDHAFSGGLDMTAITRGQPHPVWSRCSRRLVINFNHQGRYMGLVLLDDFLG